MKRLSLKTRLVLLHNGMMALVVCIVLAPAVFHQFP